VRLYDPEDFEDDILRVQVRGLGRGKGTEREWTVSIFDDEEAPIFLKLRDRISTLYSLFYDDEDRSEERGDLLYDINAALEPYYGDDAFDNLFDAAVALLGQFRDYYDEEEEDKESEAEHSVDPGDEVDFESLSDLDKELLLAEREEDDDDDVFDGSNYS